MNGSPIPELVAVDPDDGALRWRRDEFLGKFRAFGYGSADLDGDGHPELVASFTHQDGFATCSHPSDDPGMLAAYDLDDGSARCRLATDRVTFSPLAANLDGLPGDEVIAPTVGGTTWAFRDAEPGCGVLALVP